PVDAAGVEAGGGGPDGAAVGVDDALGQAPAAGGEEDGQVVGGGDPLAHGGDERRWCSRGRQVVDGPGGSERRGRGVAVAGGDRVEQAGCDLVEVGERVPALEATGGDEVGDAG